MCDVLTNAGLFSGLWDGVLAPISLVADIFLDINVFDECSGSGLYTVGFVLGLLMFGWSMRLLQGLWWIVLPISFVIWVISIIFSSFFTILLTILIIVGVYLYLNRDTYLPNQSAR